MKLLTKVQTGHILSLTKLSLFALTSITLNIQPGWGQQTFNYTGNPQIYIVPSCVTSVSITAYGAQGSVGYSGGAAGGLGGKAEATITVTPGETLRVYVGGSNGYNGGGTGGVGNWGNGGNGGGASDVRRTDTLFGSRIIVAGGGGGGGWGTGKYAGGAGGGTIGGTGINGAGGGTQSTGGTIGPGATSGTAGKLGIGGNGGNQWYGGGGGGGGYYGGGGAGGYTGGGGGGGGGSSYLTGTNTSTVSGVQSGNGKIIISTAVISFLPSITGTDTLCSGRTSILTANGGKSYLWKNTGDTTATITITPLKDTTYFVTVTDSNNCNKDTSVAIKVNSSPKDTIVGITNICKGDSTILTASGGTGYSWSTNDTTSAITIIPSVTTTYSVAVTNGLCIDTAVAIVQVTEVPVAAILGDTSLCKGNSSTLKASGVPSARDYLWNTGDTTATININPLSDTSYWVIAFNGICSDTTQKNIKVNALPAVKAEQDTTIIQGSSVLLSASGTNIINYLWTPSAGLSNDAIFNPTAKPMVTTIYVVTGTDTNNCSNKDSVTITVKDKEGCKEFFIPNAFSPNNNNFNDILYVRGCPIDRKEVKEISFAIYDRWGEKVFETADITKGWDGTYNGKALNTGVFVYYMKATLTDGNEVEQRGNISLIR